MNPQDLVLVILVLSWGSPIGSGILLTGLGVFYWGRSLDSKSKNDKSSLVKAVILNNEES